MSEKIGLKVNENLLRQNRLIIILVIFPIIVFIMMMLAIGPEMRNVWPGFIAFGVWLGIMEVIFLPMYLKSVHYLKLNKELPDVIISYDHEFNTINLFSPTGNIRIRPSKLIKSTFTSTVGRGKYSYGEIKIVYLDNQNHNQVYKTLVMDPISTSRRLNRIKNIKYEDEFDIHF